MERSLIQQRMSIERERLAGIFSLILGCLGTCLVTVVFILGERGDVLWIQLVVWLGWVAVGVMMLVWSRRRMSGFEAEHGAGAGKQDYVR